MGRSDGDATSIISGFKDALQRKQLPTLTFGDFARGYQWLLRTLTFMQHAADHGFAATRLPSFTSMPSGVLSSLAADVSDTQSNHGYRPSDP